MQSDGLDITTVVQLLTQLDSDGSIHDNAHAVFDSTHTEPEIIVSLRQAAATVLVNNGIPNTEKIIKLSQLGYRVCSDTEENGLWKTSLLFTRKGRIVF